MADRPTRSVTAPKGRPTRSRDDLGPRRRDTATIEWIGVGILVAGLIAVAAWFARDQQPQDIHGGLPAGAVVAGPAA